MELHLTKEDDDLLRAPENKKKKFFFIFGRHSISQKLDRILLVLIKRVLHIPSKLKYSKSRNIYTLTTTEYISIENILDIFKGKLKGIKGLEFKLWSKAYYYKNTHWDEVNNIQNMLKKMRGRSN